MIDAQQEFLEGLLENEFDALLLSLPNRLTKATREAARLMSKRQARFLVDSYYQIQKYRIATHLQVLQLKNSSEPTEPIQWVRDVSVKIEAFIRGVLDEYSAHHPAGKWARAQVGIGPVLAAGLLAHVDPHQCSTAGKLWRFAGLDPTIKWVGKEGAREVVREVAGGRKSLDDVGVMTVAMKLNLNPILFLQHVAALDADENSDEEKSEYSLSSVEAVAARRPWNARFKVLCWKIGDSFCKVHNKPSAYYGRVYAERKAYEIARNEAGKNAEIAKRALEEKAYGKDTEAYKHLSKGKLPPGQLELRARRYAVKLFLAHFLEVYRRVEGLPVVLPYPIAVLGHSDYLPPPGDNDIPPRIGPDWGGE